MNKFILFRCQRWPRTKQQSSYSSNNILIQTKCPHEQKPDWMRQAKKRLGKVSYIPLGGQDGHELNINLGTLQHLLPNHIFS